MTSALQNLKVFTTHPHECSYLENEEATTLFLDPKTEVNQQLYSHLSTIGFRRSGSFLYRPHCQNCNACIPARVPVALFNNSRSHKRTWKNNSDVIVQKLDNIDTDQHYKLYQCYINERHHDGDMYPPDREQYNSFLASEWNVTSFYEFSTSDKLLGVAVVDRLDDGLSAIYTFFDPEEHSRSLGTYAVLWQLQLCRQLNLPYVYLGYWIKECQKMNYKTRYQPLELLINNRWSNLL